MVWHSDAKAIAVGAAGEKRTQFSGWSGGFRREDTLCLKCGGRLIQRKRFVVVQNDLRKGRCPDCGAAISGVWK